MICFTITEIVEQYAKMICSIVQDLITIVSNEYSIFFL